MLALCEFALCHKVPGSGVELNLPHDSFPDAFHQGQKQAFEMVTIELRRQPLNAIGLEPHSRQ